MSQLQQYSVLELTVIEAGERIAPGVLVRLTGWDKSLGTVIATAYDEYVPHQETRPMQVLVLWTQPPGLFSLPNVRRVHQQLISNQLTSIQPMTAPSGLIFYLDYTYGSGSKSGSV